VSSSAHHQVELVLRDAVNEYTAALSQRLLAMYANHSAKGRLQSGATVRVAVRAMDELACEAVERMSERVREVARDSESYLAFRVAMADLVESFRGEMPKAIRMASGRMPCEPNPSIETAAYELFGQMESKVESKIELAEFAFRELSAASNRVPPVIKLGKTGRPTAAFWDDMWASIAFDLYIGDLNPRTQAELEQAMLQWIEDHGQTAATSTVRGRARRLWDLIQTRG
jgi:hypothetical protein